jgi:glutaredoxin-related protein
MRQYSESVAQAADVVDKESNYDLVDLTSTMKNTKKSDDLDRETEARTQAELAEKEALISKAEAANQVATGDSV